tara:strand:+ start:680 stop:1435 length:756 start_codon:yes stop_codon:yes gene_type:complete
VKTLATDLDGTIYIDYKLIKGVKTSYHKLIENNFHVLFTTNNSSILPNTICKKLEKLLGTELDIETIVTPLVVLDQYLLNKNKNIYVYGSLELENYVKSISYITKQIEKSDLILIGRKDNINSDEVLEISHHINIGINAMALNKDLTYPATGNKQIPGNGAVIKIIEENTNKKIQSFGKPDLLYTEYLKNNKQNISFMIGDRVDTDIMLGNNLGASSFLVNSSIDNFMNVDLADYYFESFSESVSFIIKNL